METSTRRARRVGRETGTVMGIAFLFKNYTDDAEVPLNGRGALVCTEPIGLQ